jgi:hypothetical protein
VRSVGTFVDVLGEVGLGDGSVRILGSLARCSASQSSAVTTGSGSTSAAWRSASIAWARSALARVMAV